MSGRENINDDDHKNKDEQDDDLNEALEETFPASDPASNVITSIPGSPDDNKPSKK